MATRTNFERIEKCHTGEALEAYKLLKPYFPLMKDVQSPPYHGNIDFVTPHAKGGTFLSNWELTVPQAKIAVETLKELDCPCFFIIPFPSWVGFPETAQEVAKMASKICMTLLNEDMCREAPPYFAVHTFASSQECGLKYAHLALAKWHDNLDLATSTSPKVAASSKQETNDFMKRIGIKKIS